MADKDNKNTEANAGKSKLDGRVESIINMLKNRGIIADVDIGNEKIRKAEKEKKQNMHHNTLLLLQHYQASYGYWNAFLKILRRSWTGL